MKNILFLVFLFLPFLSYSQVVSHSFEDSVLTVFIKPTTLNSEADTIYLSGVPRKVHFVFEDIDSVDSYSKNVVLVRGSRLFGKPTIDKNIYTIIPHRFINWKKDRFVITTQITKKLSVEGSISNLFIIPPHTLTKTGLTQSARDSIERLENHIVFLEYDIKHFEELKQPQENLTEKDKKKINEIYENLRLPFASKISNNKFIDRREVSNMDWIDYINSNRNYHALIPSIDSVIWRKVYGDSIFYENYMLYFVYGNYPVIGITYEQSQKYCIWLENNVSEYLNRIQKKKYQDYEITVHYRLPTKEEWEYAAIKDDLNKQFGGYSTKRRYTEKEKRKVYRSAKRYSDSTRTIENVKLDMKNYFESDTSYKRMFNYKLNYQNPYFIQETNIIDNGKVITNWVYLYNSTNQFYLYNMFGNVAEMTSKKGIAKGGSFVHSLEECAADKVQKYDSPKAWLGFRCVAEVVVRKKEGK